MRRSQRKLDLVGYRDLVVQALRRSIPDAGLSLDEVDIVCRDYRAGVPFRDCNVTILKLRGIT